MAKIDEKPDFSGLGTTFKVVYTDSSAETRIKVTTRSYDLKKQLNYGTSFTTLMANEFRTSD